MNESLHCIVPEDQLQARWIVLMLLQSFCTLTFGVCEKMSLELYLLPFPSLLQIMSSFLDHVPPAIFSSTLSSCGPSAYGVRGSDCCESWVTWGNCLLLSRTSLSKLRVTRISSVLWAFFGDFKLFSCGVLVVQKVPSTS